MTYLSAKAAPSTWTVSQVCQWLKSLDYVKYVEAIEENEIDGETLRALSGDDFEELIPGPDHRTKETISLVTMLDWVLCRRSRPFLLMFGQVDRSRNNTCLKVNLRLNTLSLFSSVRMNVNNWGLNHSLRMS